MSTPPESVSPDADVVRLREALIEVKHLLKHGPFVTEDYRKIVERKVLRALASTDQREQG